MRGNTAMKVLLVQPRQADRFYDFVRLPPLGLAYIAAALRRDGHEVSILDASASSDESRALASALERSDPQLVGFSASTPLFAPALAMARRLKAWRPEVPTLFGGVHASWRPEAVAACPEVDYVVFGEGEVTVIELLRALMAGRKPAGVHGVAYRDQDRVVVNPPRRLVADLDDLPLPAYDLLPISSYSRPQSSSRIVCSMITSRGCPYSCIFCDANLVFGRRYRFHSPERTLQEAFLLRDRFAVREISFKDSEFTLDLGRLERLCDLMVAEKLDVSWTCNSRVGRLTEALLGKMRAAGCRMIWFGVESGDAQVLRVLNKEIALPAVEETFRLSRRAGIGTVANFLVGSPGESAATLKRTLDLAMRLNPDYVNFSRLVPYPGTALYDMAMASGWIQGAPDSPGGGMNATALSAAALERAHRRMYRRFYLRPGYLLRRLRRTSPWAWGSHFRGLAKVIRGS